ncbi:hypothetical protein RJ641_024225 [Dillenia turbinata]|uniref:Uncharacterized protein n=1 Tax=Dillenia turbinata TaxID=194707 RepID=A0AAN8UKZ3_9MAGN
MDTGEVSGLSSSFRRNGSILWKDKSMEVFSRSSREEDDEEALKWAALEKLPTYSRLKKGLLASSVGAPNEIDIDDLGFDEKKKLVERLVKVAEEDNERFLLKLRNRIDRSQIRRIPVWWRWYYWANPVAWTLYGLVGSQFGDIQGSLDTGETVEDFLRSYFGFKHSFIGACAGVVVGLTLVFAFIFAFSIKAFNFQRR